MKMDSHTPLQLSYGFIMDGVQSLRNVTKMASISQSIDRKVRSSGTTSVIPKYLTVYPDPELDPFSGVKRFYFTRNEYLNLNVSLACCLFRVICHSNDNRF